MSYWTKPLKVQNSANLKVNAYLLNVIFMGQTNCKMYNKLIIFFNRNITLNYFVGNFFLKKKKKKFQFLSVSV